MYSDPENSTQSEFPVPASTESAVILRLPEGSPRISTVPQSQPHPSSPICGAHSHHATFPLKQRSKHMGLLERVSTLIRANINDVIDRAEDPEKMIKQVILDMDNQYMQVKTQVAISIADLHMLEKKRKENQESMDEWFRKAEKSVEKQQDDLARIALERYRSFQRMAQSYSEQVSDQQTQVEGLKTALQKLEQKLVE